MKATRFYNVKHSVHRQSGSSLLLESNMVIKSYLPFLNLTVNGFSQTIYTAHATVVHLEWPQTEGHCNVSLI